MRNHYESEIGHFKNAYCPDVDTFREEIQLVIDKYKDEKDKQFCCIAPVEFVAKRQVLFLFTMGSKTFLQLHGGIIEYAQQIKQLALNQNSMVKTSFSMNDWVNRWMDK